MLLAARTGLGRGCCACHSTRRCSLLLLLLRLQKLTNPLLLLMAALTCLPAWRAMTLPLPVTLKRLAAAWGCPGGNTTHEQEGRGRVPQRTQYHGG
jgi:hypothetical protein